MSPSHSSLGQVCPSLHRFSFCCFQPGILIKGHFYSLAHGWPGARLALLKLSTALSIQLPHVIWQAGMWTELWLQLLPAHKKISEHRGLQPGWIPFPVQPRPKDPQCSLQLTEHVGDPTEGQEPRRKIHQRCPHAASDHLIGVPWRKLDPPVGSTGVLGACELDPPSPKGASCPTTGQEFF